MRFLGDEYASEKRAVAKGMSADGSAKTLKFPQYREYRHYRVREHDIRPNEDGQQLLRRCCGEALGALAETQQPSSRQSATSGAPASAPYASTVAASARASGRVTQVANRREGDVGRSHLSTRLV